MKFELYEDTVVYTNGDIGAILITPEEGVWLAFSYFYNGDIQINDGIDFSNPIDASEFARDYYS